MKLGKTKVWTGLKQLRIRPNCGFVNSDRPSGSIKAGNYLTRSGEKNFKEGFVGLS
jgi:hypothetical protein